MFVGIWSETLLSSVAPTVFLVKHFTLVTVLDTVLITAMLINYP